MAGYDGFSKSNAALEAERQGLYPASRVARMLGVPVAAVRAAGPDEWHHTSSRYNRTVYYDLERVRDYLASPEGQAAVSQARARGGETAYADCAVEWIEWSGSVRHPRATVQRRAGCAVSVKGKTYTITLPNGQVLRKRTGTHGLAITLPDGSHLR